MKDRFSNEIGTKEPLNNWTEINWKPIKKRVRNLRQRIYRATENRQWNKVRSLMKLMLRSYSNLLLSVRKVTQENQGRKTAGLDGQTALTPGQRMILVKEMQEHSLWQVRPTKRIYIPKASGTKLRPLGIPTIKNRIAQTIVKNALEPTWEARFEAHSYGFRPGRSCQDAIEQCHNRLRGGQRSSQDQWVLDADIKGAFDNISHDYILNTIGNSPGRNLIKQWLKAGYVEAEVFHKTESGTPQGGCISPLLANIALDGMEKLLSSYIKLKTYQPSPTAKRQQIVRRQSAKYGFIRYADDFLVTAQSQEDIEAIIPVLSVWLQQRGLELNQEKTKVIHVPQGLNFLGFHIRQFHHNCFTFPQKDKVLDKLREIQQWLNQHRHTQPEAVIQFLNPILRGWANYYKFCCSKRTFSYFHYRLWRMLWYWALKRHPNKSKTWVAHKYFRSLNGVKWTFSADARDRHGNQITISLFNITTIPIQRYSKVKGTASPDDPALVPYWLHRQTSQGKTYWAKGSKYYSVAQHQDWKCPVCGEHLFNGEQLQLHHLVPIKDAGTDKQENLVHLHKTCHQHLHTGKHSRKP